MKKLNIIYEDKDILVVNKPSNMLTISDGVKTNTLYAEVKEYVKKQHKSNKIFIVHRLDKETSGLVLFAKTVQTKEYLQNHWREFTREYIAIVEGVLKDNRGVIKNYLAEDKTHRIYLTDTHHGEYAETHFEVIKRNKFTTSVLINIKTGKRHQIRLGFKSIGHPLMGDKKYGSKLKEIKRLALHATYLKIKLNNQVLEFTCNVPPEFLKYM